jgi:cytochrome bd-type quinol oxidase subunit 2
MTNLSCSDAVYQNNNILWIFSGLFLGVLVFVVAYSIYYYINMMKQEIKEESIEKCLGEDGFNNHSVVINNCLVRINGWFKLWVSYEVLGYFLNILSIVLSISALAITAFAKNMQDGLFIYAAVCSFLVTIFLFINQFLNTSKIIMFYKKCWRMGENELRKFAYKCTTDNQNISQHVKDLSDFISIIETNITDWNYL